MGSFSDNGWDAESVIPNRPVGTQVSTSSNKSTGKTRAAITSNEPVVKLMDLATAIKDSKPRGFANGRCRDGDLVVPSGTKLVNLFQVSPLRFLNEKCPIFFQDFQVMDHLTGTKVMNDDGTPKIVQRIFGVCPRCAGTGLYLKPKPKADLVDGHVNRCFLCYSAWPAPADWPEVGGLTLVEYPKSETFLLNVWIPTVRPYIRAIIHLNSENLRLKALQEFVKIMVPLADNLARILGYTPDAEELAEAAGLSLADYRDAKGARNVFAAGLWRYTTDDGLACGVADIMDNLQNLFGGAVGQYRQAVAAAKSSRPLGNATRQSVLAVGRPAIFAISAESIQPGPKDASQLDQAGEAGAEARMAARAVTGLEKFFGDETSLTSRGLTVVAARALLAALQGDRTPKTLHDALHVKGMGPKSRQVVLSGAGVQSYEFDALGRCL